MLITCDDCGAQYRIPESKLTREINRATCRKCGAKLIISRSGTCRVDEDLRDVVEEVVNHEEQTVISDVPELQGGPAAVSVSPEQALKWLQGEAPSVSAPPVRADVPKATASATVRNSPGKNPSGATPRSTTAGRSGRSGSRTTRLTAKDSVQNVALTSNEVVTPASGETAADAKNARVTGGRNTAETAKGRPGHDDTPFAKPEQVDAKTTATAGATPRDGAAPLATGERTTGTDRAQKPARKDAARPASQPAPQPSRLMDAQPGPDIDRGLVVTTSDTWKNAPRPVRLENGRRSAATRTTAQSRPIAAQALPQAAQPEQLPMDPRALTRSLGFLALSIAGLLVFLLKTM